MRTSSFRISIRRLVGIGAALTVALGTAATAGGCEGRTTEMVASGTPGMPGTTGGAASATPVAAADTTAGRVAHGPIGGMLEGLDCRARVHSAVRRSLFAHEFTGTAGRLVEQEGTLAFEPVRLGHGGGTGDIASGLETFVALDAAGRLHYLEVEILREHTDGPVVANVATDIALVGGLAGAKALAATVVGHAYGDPEVFVVDAGGRLLRYTLVAQGPSVTASAPTVLADGLGDVTALGADLFDLDGDLAEERAAATRLVMMDGDVVRQMIVRRDSSHDPLAVLVGPQPSLTGATAVTRMWCARPDGQNDDRGALVVFEASGAGRVFAGSYTPAVRDPRLVEVATTDVVPGLLAG